MRETGTTDAETVRGDPSLRDLEAAGEITVGKKGDLRVAPGLNRLAKLPEIDLFRGLRILKPDQAMRAGLTWTSDLTAVATRAHSSYTPIPTERARSRHFTILEYAPG